MVAPEKVVVRHPAAFHCERNRSERPMECDPQYVAKELMRLCDEIASRGVKLGDAAPHEQDRVIQMLHQVRR